MPIHNERASRLLSAIRAVAASDVYRVTAHAVADRPAEASARAYSRLHARIVLSTAVGQRSGMTSEDVRLDLAGADEFLVVCRSLPRTDP